MTGRRYLILMFHQCRRLPYRKAQQIAYLTGLYSDFKHFALGMYSDEMLADLTTLSSLGILRSTPEFYEATDKCDRLAEEVKRMLNPEEIQKFQESVELFNKFDADVLSMMAKASFIRQ